LSKDLPILIQFYHSKISSISPQELLIAYNQALEEDVNMDKFIPFVYFKISITQNLLKNPKFEIRFIDENLNEKYFEQQH
jgi:hypothetical protein